MIENREDKYGGIPLEWKWMEKIHWERLKNRKRLFDPLFCKKQDVSDIWYTWCNFQSGKHRIFCRLDRFYANKDHFTFNLGDNGSPISVLLTTLSDHHPIICQVRLRDFLEKQATPKDKFLLNSSLVLDTDVLSAVKIVRMFNRRNRLLNSCVERWNQNVDSW